MHNGLHKFYFDNLVLCLVYYLLVNTNTKFFFQNLDFKKNTVVGFLFMAEALKITQI